MKIKKHPVIYLVHFLLILNWACADLNTYYVKFSSSPFTSSLDHIESQHSTFHNELKKRGIDVKIGHIFKRYANGISIETDERHVKRIAEIEHVESIEPIEPVLLYKRSQDKPFEIKIKKEKLTKRDESYRNEPILIAPNNDINSVHEITGVKKVHQELGLTGKGVKVGIIDTGIDYRHPALGGCFGPGCRIAYGYNFVDETNDPIDICNGHGTHVAAIIGGLDTKIGFKGVAPNVIFGAYRAITCDGGTETSMTFSFFEVRVMRAIEKAVDDGMEIINLSIGIPGNNRKPLSLMVNELAKHKGIIFMAASGNSGRNGTFTYFEPAVAMNAIGVGSIETNKVLNFKAFDTKNPKFVINYIKRNVTAFPFDKAEVKLFQRKDCFTNDYEEFDNKVIVVDERNGVIGPCPLIADRKVKLLGILYIESNIQVLLRRDVGNLTPKQADILIKYLEKHPNLELDFSDKYGYMKDHPFAVTSSVFSGWGLSDEFDVKPEICAPGGLIISAYTISSSPYLITSGTSMAAPYMVGVAALYIEAFGKQKSFKQLKAALMNYAIPIKDQNKLLSSVLHQGSGLVSIYDTLKGTSFVYPPKINLNDTIHFNKYHKLNIYNAGRKEMKYKLSHLPAPSLNGYNKTFVRSYPELEYLTNNYASVEFENDLITVAPGVGIKVSVTFDPPKNLPKDEHWFYSGWLQITPLDEKMPVMTVPYAGLADDARRLPIFQTPKFPQLINVTNEIRTYSFKLPDVPVIQLNLATQIHAIFIEVLDGNHKLLGLVREESFVYFARIQVPLVWNGVIYNPNSKQYLSAPNGEYFLRVKALKLFGDIKNENGYEVWVSPKFRINRIA